jgi:hypothetical protein
MSSHAPFGHLHHKLGAKEGPGIKLASTRPRCAQGECDTPLESSQGELQVCFRPRPNRRSEKIFMTSWSLRSPNRDNFGTPPWESWDKRPFGCGCSEIMQRIVYKGRWWLPLSLGRGESSESVLPVACPNTKNGSEGWLVFDAGSSN